MPCRFISDISIPNIMEHLSLEEPPEGGEQRIFQDIDTIQVSPHRPGELDDGTRELCRCAPESLSYIAPEKMGGWKTILSYGVKVTVQGRTVKLPGCFCSFMTVLYTSISCKHAIPCCYSRDCFRSFLL